MHTEIITAVKDTLLALAGATTATVAVIGLKNWSRELRGKAAFETARALARATYKLRDELKLCRSPLIRSTEFPDGYQTTTSNKTADEQAQAYAHVYANRWNPVWTALQEFDTQTLEAEALWGNPIREKTDQLRGCVREINAAIEAVINNERSGGEDFVSNKDFGKKMRRVVFSSSNESNNELSTRISDAIKGIEDEIRPHLRRA